MGFAYVVVLLVTWGYACFRAVGNVGFIYVFVLVMTWGLCMFSCC